MKPENYPGLPKWPAMVVVGDPVTVEQAEEILIRTDGLSFCSNAREAQKEFYRILGLETDEWGSPYGGSTAQDYRNSHDKWQSVASKLRVLNEISYLRNARILSSYIGGPHGWCDWNGSIFSNSYNIGKWPSVEVVRDEWKCIAKAFPYLKLRCQLFSGEQCEEGSEPVVEFRVSKGRVRVMEPKDCLSIDPTLNLDPIKFALPPHIREVGVSFDRFKKVIGRLLSNSY